MRNCPELLSAATQEEQEIEEGSGSVPMANVTIHTIATLNTTVPLGPTEFLMDSGSQVSVARYEFLEDIYRRPSGFQGLHGEPTRTEHKGFLHGLGECIASDKARVNVLSLAMVEDVSDVEYIPGTGFVVRFEDTVIVFKRRKNLYVADLSS